MLYPRDWIEMKSVRIHYMILPCVNSHPRPTVSTWLLADEVWHDLLAQFAHGLVGVYGNLGIQSCRWQAAMFHLAGSRLGAPDGRLTTGVWSDPERDQAFDEMNALFQILVSRISKFIEFGSKCSEQDA